MSAMHFNKTYYTNKHFGNKKSQLFQDIHLKDNMEGDRGALREFKNKYMPL